MKKVLLSIFTITALISNAQTLTYANSSPAWGNPVYQTMQFDSTGISAGASGSWASWNFQTIGLNNLKTFTTSNSLPTNPLYSSSNVSVSSSLTDISYYHSDVNHLKYYGGNVNIGAFNLNINYSTPAIFANYPMSLNSSTTSVTSGTINVTSPLPVSGNFNGNCHVIVDGSGTLALPTRTFSNVIRTVTSQTLDATFAGGVHVNLTIYDYYSSYSKQPIISINTSTISSALGGTSTQTITTVLKDYSTVGINETHQPTIDVSVYPNPATNFVNFYTSSNHAFKIYTFDITGKNIATELFEMGKVKLNTGSLNNGIYLFQIIDKNNQILKTGKFSINN